MIGRKGKEIWHGAVERFRGLRRSEIQEPIEPPHPHTPEQIGANLVGSVQEMLRAYDALDIVQSIDGTGFYEERIAARLFHYAIDTEGNQGIDQQVFSYLWNGLPTALTFGPKDNAETELIIDRGASKGARVLTYGTTSDVRNKLVKTVLDVVRGKNTSIAYPKEPSFGLKFRQSLLECKKELESLSARDEGGVGNVDVIEAKEKEEER